MSRNLPESLYSIKGSNFDAFELPQIKEIRGKEYMYYGKKNLFPQKLIELYDTSAMHHTAVNAIADGIFGEGIKNFGDEFINSKGETLDDIFKKVSLDYTLYSGYSLNVIWSKDKTKIVDIFHIPFDKVRSGKMDDEGNVNEYYYSSDWKDLRKNPAVPYRSFSTTDNKGENASQIYYCFDYTPGLDVYPLPSYVASISDIELDARVSVFHNQNLANGLSPSLFINFRNGIPTESERNQIYKELENTFSGESNAGKFFLGFSRPGEEMTVEPIDSANDDYYVVLDARISSRILTAHRITSPLLLGISSGSGFSSNADEIKTAYVHFEATVVEPKRKKILNTMGMILKFAGYNVSLEVEPKTLTLEVTTTQETETKTID